MDQRKQGVIATVSKGIRRKLVILFLLISPYSMTQDTTNVSIWFPQNSGLAFVDYAIFTIQDSNFYFIERTTNTGSFFLNDSLDDKIEYAYDTLKIYPVTALQLEQLNNLLDKTDAFGHHTADGCIFIQGWPRFLIYSNYKGEEMNGYLANCYRENLFRFIDLFNEIYPDGDVLAYDKNVLIKLEADCNKND